MAERAAVEFCGHGSTIDSLRNRSKFLRVAWKLICVLAIELFLIAATRSDGWSQNRILWRGNRGVRLGQLLA